MLVYSQFVFSDRDFTAVDDLYGAGLAGGKNGEGDSDGVRGRAVNVTHAAYDWIFISGDDTALFVDSLKRYLSFTEIITAAGTSKLGFSRPLYLGQPWNWNSGVVFNHGGAGYLLNAAALRVFVYMVLQGYCYPHATVSMVRVSVIVYMLTYSDCVYVCITYVYLCASICVYVY